MPKAYAFDHPFVAAGWHYQAGDVLSLADLAVRGMPPDELARAVARNIARPVDTVAEVPLSTAIPAADAVSPDQGNDTMGLRGQVLDILLGKTAG